MKIGILGAGVVGLTSAWWLAEAGHQVVIVDRHATPGAEASRANGAQLSYNFVAPFASPAMLRKLPGMLLSGEDAVRVSPSLDLVRWGIGFLRACTNAEVARTLVAQLALATLSRAELELLLRSQDIEFGLRTAGKLVLYRSAGDFAEARLPGADAEQQVLTPAECLALEPGLRLAARALAGGVYTPSEQVGDCAAFCAALFALLKQHRNADVRMATPIGNPVVTRGRLTAIETAHGKIEADGFVLSLGSGSKAFARACGFDLPIYPVKGHSITIPGRALSHSVTDYSRKIVYAPLEGATRVAGFADFKGYDNAIEPTRIATLKAAALQTFAIEDTGSNAPWAGLRPMTPDSRPVIGASPLAGLFLNTGQGMLGWTLACGSARLLTDLIDGREPACPPEPFSAARYV
ncbi:MAG: D-amino acid dehydrogenase [Pseudolabrys sp.]|nr:D-amino acid dehydrogenase [Pseudolabrys sp.]MDP2295539.1 D-amino acid dehydrogenase [Pseudolabrys sp.]